MGVRWVLIMFVVAWAVLADEAPMEDPKSPDYLDDVKHFSQHNVEEIAHKYAREVNELDYPDDEEDYDDEDEYDEDEEEEDDDDDDGGGCGGGDDDDEDYDDEDYDDEDDDRTPVERVIDEFFS